MYFKNVIICSFAILFAVSCSKDKKKNSQKEKEVPVLEIKEKIRWSITSLLQIFRLKKRRDAFQDRRNYSAYLCE